MNSQLEYYKNHSKLSQNRLMVCNLIFPEFTQAFQKKISKAIPIISHLNHLYSFLASSTQFYKTGKSSEKSAGTLYTISTNQILQFHEDY